MNFVLRPFAGYLLLIALGAYFGNRIAESELKPAMRRAVEELLVDTANLLAEVATPPLASPMGSQVAPSVGSSSSETRQADTARLAAAHGRFSERQFTARIYDVAKHTPDLRLYITDAQGRVTFDSSGAPVGTDFSRWNDVYRTLRGDYGARATRTEPKNPASSVLYVAAPLYHDGRIAGVLTVGKSSLGFEPFVAQARASIVRAGSLLIAAAVVIALALSWWIGRDLRRLSQYARDASTGRRVAAPRFRGGELATLSNALATMREELEGKAHVERFAQLLTHELKSPLAAIAGAAELLEEPMTAEDHRRFVTNIRGQTAHLQSLVERLAQLTVLEHQRVLTAPAWLDARELVHATVAARQATIAARDLRVTVEVGATGRLYGDGALLRLALANLLDNAIAFSPSSGTIHITHRRDGATDVLEVLDRGSGIPDYARERVFERFYSLPRADTGVKSTGLGLLLVREVAALHGGSVTLTNRPDGGAVARLTLAHGLHDDFTGKSPQLHSAPSSPA